MSSGETITLQTEQTPRGGPTEAIVPVNLGPVRLIREIGRGGMGVVYLGRHELLGRDVAVKFLLNAVADAGDPGFARFIEGARAATQVAHPGLITIHHADLAEGIPFLVMQYVNGPTLTDVVRREGFLGVAETVAVLEAVAEAIGALHDRGIVHGDIKPRNILLDPEGHLYVTDFGLACFRPMGTSNVTAERLPGTPAYMAPEMIEGSLSVRSDVYALGITAYEMLTGRPPFAGSPRELHDQHLNAPLPIAGLEQRKVPPELIAVLEQATHKTAFYRYKTARHFSGSLRAFASDELRRKGTEQLGVIAARYAVDPSEPTPVVAAAAKTPTTSYFDALAQLALKKRGAEGDLDELREPSEPVSPALPAALPLVESVPCAKCQYDLRGLTAGGQCPECGEPVSASLNPNRLQFADPQWLRRVARGLTVFLAAFLCQILAIFFFAGVEIAKEREIVASWARPLALLALVGTTGALVFGMFMATTPQSPKSPYSHARIWRWLICFFGVLMMILAFRFSLRQRPPWIGLPDVGFAVTSFLYFRGLASRIPASRLMTLSIIVLVLLAAAAFLVGLPRVLAKSLPGYLVILSFLSASYTALTISLVSRLRKRIRTIAPQAVTYDSLFSGAIFEPVASARNHAVDPP